ncbi:hypothetical protein QYF61_012319 [Mycteria americana]|uniref:Uncharacterized protein n=1 Tax=Mycteria americana TaxID=33587 RepID=A0AAN7MY94_MYCAM|nr:hypothetical protein QYF61_012319 [Mycteria americana]
MKGLEHLLHERLSKLGVFSLEKRRLGGEHLHVQKYLMGGSKKIETVSSRWYPGKGIPFKHKKNAFFSMRVVKQWNRLPGEVVESPSTEIFKIQWDTVLDSLPESEKIDFCQESNLTDLKELAKAGFTSFLVATFEVFYLYHPILLPKNVEHLNLENWLAKRIFYLSSERS